MIFKIIISLGIAIMIYYIIKWVQDIIANAKDMPDDYDDEEESEIIKRDIDEDRKL